MCGVIRTVDPDKDVADIARIYRGYVENSVATFELDPLSESGMLSRIRGVVPDYPYFVWEEEGKVAGYCYAHPWKSYPAYRVTLETTVYIDPEAKGKGGGTRLMRRLIEECRRRGFISLIACITAENEESCRFHEKLGFEKVSSFRKVGKKFNRLLDVVDYQLALGNFLISN